MTTRTSKHLICSFLLLMVSITQAGTTPFFQCEQPFSPALQVKQLKFCGTSHVGKLPSTRKQLGFVAFNNLLYHLMLQANNMGGIKVLFPKHHEKIVYRSAYLSSAPLCIHSLSNQGVKTIINLYSGKHVGFSKQLNPLEKEIYRMNHINHYIHINHFMVNEHRLTPPELNATIAHIIHLIEVAHGNVLIHCYTGEHNTGVIFGVLNKCYNKASMAVIQQDTLCHMGNESNYQKKTFKHAMHLIKQFPCHLLSTK